MRTECEIRQELKAEIIQESMINIAPILTEIRGMLKTIRALSILVGAVVCGGAAYLMIAQADAGSGRPIGALQGLDHL
jgi:hypothetical protein